METDTFLLTELCGLKRSGREIIILLTALFSLVFV